MHLGLDSSPCGAAGAPFRREPKPDDSAVIDTALANHETFTFERVDHARNRGLTT